MLSSALPKSAAGCDDLAAGAEIVTVQKCGAELFAVINDKFGCHQLNLVSHLSFDTEDAIVRRYEKVSEMLGPEYHVRICDPWNQKPDEPVLYSAPIEIMLTMRADRCDLVFSANLEGPDDDDEWVENESGDEVLRKLEWYEEEYRLDEPDHRLYASTWVINEVEKMLALEYGVKRALSISPLVNRLGGVESLITIERELLASDFPWETERYTWT